ncbi:MAG: Do family serine endopeptidase [Spirochaetota bacterium]|nr:Do family serine endopeptidase [Spirochaetota bacterium]
MTWNKKQSLRAIWLSFILFTFSLQACSEGDKDLHGDKVDFSSESPAIEKDKESLQKGMSFQKALKNVADKVLPAVVDIRAEKVTRSRNRLWGFRRDQFERFDEFFGRRKKPDLERKAQSLGSGFIISREGYVVTNNHVIEGASNIKVFLTNNREYTGQVVGTDAVSDLAVIKIDAGNDIPSISLSSQEKVNVGDLAIAVGNPFGLSGSFTLGVVSATGRVSGINDRNAAFKDFIQTDASINQGNSGGPLLNIKGQVIGVNTAIYSAGGQGSLGIGFAIPASVAKRVVTDIIRQGRVDRGYIGVIIKNLDKSVSDYLNLKKTDGVLITAVEPKGPAEIAGLRSGDVILSVNKKKVRNTTDLIKLVSTVKPGKRVILTILRKKKVLNVSLRVKRRPDRTALQKNRTIPKWDSHIERWMGLSLAAVSLYGKQFGLKNKSGVMVIQIDSDDSQPLPSVEILPGDILESVNYLPVTDMLSLRRIIKQLAGKKKYFLSLTRNGKRFFSVIQLKQE